IRVPTRSAGTRSGVNCRRLNEPPRTSETVLTVSVLARPGTPSRSTWPPARRATITRSSIASWPTITRLISNRAASSASCASRAGEILRVSSSSLRVSSSSPSSARNRLSSGVTYVSPSLAGPAVMVSALRRVVRSVAERDRHGLAAAVALQFDLHGIARLAREHGLPEIRRVGDVVPVEGGDQVTGAQARGLGGAAGDLADQRAVVAGLLGGGDAEPGALDLAMRLQLRHDVLDGIAREREADARVAVRAVVGDLRVDADDLALGVQERAAGVAGVDRGVRLQGAGDREAVGGLDVAVERGDDALGDRPLQAERAADGDGGLAWDDLAGVGDGERLEAARDLAGIDLEHGEVGRGVGADDVGGDRRAVLAEPDDDAAGAFDDMVVGHDRAVGGDDEAGAGGLALGR